MSESVRTGGLPDECRLVMSTLMAASDTDITSVDTASDIDWVEIESHLENCPACAAAAAAGQYDWAGDMDRALLSANANISIPEALIPAPAQFSDPAFVNGLQPSPNQGTARRTSALWLLGGALAASLLLCFTLGPSLLDETASHDKIPAQPIENLEITDLQPPERDADSATSELSSGRTGAIDVAAAFPLQSSPTPAISLRAQNGYEIVQQDESEDIPFYWVLPTGTRVSVR